MTGGAAVELSHQQLAWLDQTLAAHRQQPTIIFCHAPLEQTAVSSRPGISLPSPRNSVQPAGDIRTILARHHQVRLWVSGHTHTMPSDATFMDDANYYEAASSMSTTAIGMKIRFIPTPSTSMKTISSSGPMTIPAASGSRPSTVL